MDPDNLVAETYEINNHLLDRTNALGFRLAITPEMYEAYNTPWDPAFSYSAWNIGPTMRPARYTGEKAHNGQRSVLLGYKPGEGDSRTYSSVWQAIPVPADADSATLSFWTFALSDLDDVGSAPILRHAA